MRFFSHALESQQLAVEADLVDCRWKKFLGYDLLIYHVQHILICR